MNCITIKNICIKARLGVSQKERACLQKISWTVRWKVLTLEKSNFVCYKKVSEKVRQLSKSKEFFFIEEMGVFCFKELKKSFPKIKKLSLSLHKLNPPVSEIKGGVVFDYGDF